MITSKAITQEEFTSYFEALNDKLDAMPCQFVGTSSVSDEQIEQHTKEWFYSLSTNDQELLWALGQFTEFKHVDIYKLVDEQIQAQEEFERKIEEIQRGRYV